MSTATLQTIFLFLQKCIYTLQSSSHFIHKWSSGSIMVKISLIRAIIYFAPRQLVRGSGGRIGHPNSADRPETDEKTERPSFTSPEGLRALWCGCGNCWDTKEIIGNKPTLPSSHHLLLPIAFTKVPFLAERGESVSNGHQWR